MLMFVICRCPAFCVVVGLLFFFLFVCLFVCLFVLIFGGGGCCCCLCFVVSLLLFWGNGVFYFLFALGVFLVFLFFVFSIDSCNILRPN